MNRTVAAGEISDLVQDQAARLFAEHAGRAVLDAAEAGTYPAGLWSAVAEAGFALALVAEEEGGAGLEVADALRLLRLAAYHTAPIPLAETMLAAWLWSMAGGAVPAGEITLAPVRPGGTLSLRDGRIEGSAEGIPWGLRAGHCLAFAGGGPGRPLLALVPVPSLAVTESGRNLAFEPRDRVRFTSVPLPQAAIRPAPDWMGSDGLLELGAVLRAQQMVGAMQRCLDHALSYAVERVQFGRPIARFQAIQQMLAVAAGHLAAATAVADEAIDAVARRDIGLAAAVAKARVGEAAGEVASICHQVHGAMGFTQEHPLHFATRRLWSWRDEFGGEAFWQERIGRRVCAGGGEALWPMLAGA